MQLQHVLFKLPFFLAGGTFAACHGGPHPESKTTVSKSVPLVFIDQLSARYAGGPSAVAEVDDATG
jgi:hypothetical protein